MGGRTTQTQNSTQTTSLPQDQQTNVDLLMSGARDQFHSGGPQYFGGNTVAATDPNTTAGRGAATNFANGQGLNFTQGLLNGEKTFLDPNNIFNPTNIPGYAAARQGVMTDATNNLTRNILPQLRAGSVADGAYGGSRQGIAEGLAAGETGRGVADTLAQMDMSAYNSGLNQYNQAANRAPESFSLGLQPANTLSQVGAANQQDQQNQINSNVSRWNFDQLRPLLNLQSLQGLTGTAGTYGGTTTGTQTQSLSGGSPLTQGLGTILSLASMLPTGGLGGMLGGLGGGLGPWGQQAAQIGLG